MLDNLASASQSPPGQLSATVEYILGNAENKPSSGWLQEVKIVVSTVPLSALSDVRDDVLRHCVNHWKKALRSPDHFDAMTSLFIAFHIDQFGLSRRTSSNVGTLGTPLSSAMSRWMEDAARLFRGESGVNVVKTTVLRTIMYCSPRLSAAPADQAVEAVEMAREILSGVKRSIVEAWVSENGVAVSKLLQKLLQPEIRPALQAVAFGVFCAIDPDGHAGRGTEVLQQLLHHVTSSPCLLAPSDVERPQAIGARVMTLMIQHLQDQNSPLTYSPEVDGMRHVLSFILDQCQPGQSLTVDTWARRKWAFIFLNELRCQMMSCPSSALIILFVETVNRMRIPEWWALNLATPHCPENCGGMIACPHHAEKMRQQLSLQFSFTVLEVVAASAATLTNEDFCLLKEQITQTCAMETYSCVYPLSAVQQPPEWQLYEDARVGLYAPQGTRSSMSQQRAEVSKTVKSIVPWQIRQGGCEEAEPPLRAPNERIAELRRTLAKMKADLWAFGDDPKALRIPFSIPPGHRALEVAGHGRAHHKQLSTWRCQYQSLHQKLIKTIEAMEGVKAEYERHLNAIVKQAQDDAYDMKLDHKAHVLALEDQLESEVEKGSELEADVDWLKKQIGELKKQANAAHDVEMLQLKEQHAKELGRANQKVSGITFCCWAFS